MSILHRTLLAFGLVVAVFIAQGLFVAVKLSSLVNLVSTATDAVSLAVTTGTGSLVGTATVNAVAGVATFGALTIEAAGTGKQRHRAQNHRPMEPREDVLPFLAKRQPFPQLRAGAAFVT